MLGFRQLPLGAVLLLVGLLQVLFGVMNLLQSTGHRITVLRRAGGDVVNSHVGTYRLSRVGPAARSST
jgi:hypothetical protein